jgi:hypothetical protein
MRRVASSFDLAIGARGQRGMTSIPSALHCLFCPSGKSLLIYRINVKPQNKKYFAFPEG